MISENNIKNPPKNFSYLNDLIENSKEIILDNDIILDDSEKELFEDGIEIIKDIVIDGCNNIIDAKGKASIFNINTNKILLKNIIFKNGHSLENGGAIKHQQGKIDMINCQFINNTSKNSGGAITCSFKSELQVINSKFLKNKAKESGCISNFDGNLEIIECEFLENTAKTNASTIINTKNGFLTIKESVFEKNFAADSGTIVNFGKCSIFYSAFKKNTVNIEGGAINNQNRSRLKIKDSKFIENVANDNSGAIINFSRASIENVEFLRNYCENQAGAISNQKRGSLTIKNSRFIENTANDNGGAIINFSRASIENAEFLRNYCENQAGAISNQKGATLTINNSNYIDNKASMTSGAILNWGKLEINNSKFANNISKEYGGAIFNQESSFIKITDSEFINNEVEYEGGAIVNWAQMYLKELLFKNNKNNYGGTIESSKKAQSIIEKCEFDNNKLSLLNNSDNTKIIDCTFLNHQNHVIHNFKSLSIFDSDFRNNNSINIIKNTEEGFLSINGGTFKNNYVEDSIISHKGKICNITKSKFENNHSIKEFTNICNENEMTLNDIKISSNKKSILNKHTIDAKNLSKKFIEKHIHNLGKINDFSKKSANKYDFSYLQKRIDKKSQFKKPNLKINNDINLELYELDYFEGGIEINTNNLTIDGNNHTINGENRSRIFIINAKNVTLKNIVLKNGFFKNYLNEYSQGGGAIQISKNATVILENITFINNESSTTGGAILNNGNIKSINSKFINNNSNNHGGAINNKGELKIIDDQYKNNSSRVGGAIYNQGKLTIKNKIVLDNNKSEFKQEIYNANLVNTKDFKDLIFNTSKINEKKYISKTFTYLENEIEKLNEIQLNNDIIFNYETDYHLKYTIEICKDLIIDGNGHSIEFNPLNEDLPIIDGNKSSSLFKILKQDVCVVLKNIIFKNCYSNNKSIIENNGNLKIENCKFVNNQITNGNNLIENKCNLKIINSDFSNNISNNQPLLKNLSKLKLINTKFINNRSQSIGCCITNNKEAIIKNSIFKSNTTTNKGGCIHNEYTGSITILNNRFEYNHAEIDAGAIYNYGILHISDSKFTKNSSNDTGGVINSRTSGDIKILNSEFRKNHSKSHGGVIYNYGNIVINDSIFLNNSAKKRSSVIEHARPLDNRRINHLKISNSRFINNSSKEIFSFKKDTIEIKECKFNR